MQLISLSTAILLFSQPRYSVAVFTDSNPSPCNGVHFAAPNSYSCIGTASRPWRKLADNLIRRIWGSSIQGPINDETGKSFANEDVVEASISSRYGGEVVLRFSISTEEEALSLYEASNILFLDVWEVKEDWVDIRLAKDVVPSLLGLLPKSLQNAHKPLMDERELLRAIANTFPTDAQKSQSRLYTLNSPTSLDNCKSLPTESRNIFFQNYQPLSVIKPWMELMQDLFPTHVRIVNVGTSYEGRDIPAFKLGVHPTNDNESSEPRQTILITGGLHAREWISTSTVTYIAYSLITSYGKNSVVTKLLDSYNWVLVPTLNPDGYVYTWKIDRLWRKNRQPTSLRFCRGVNLDRSWSYHWNDEANKTESNDDGSDDYLKLSSNPPDSPVSLVDDNPCSDSYAGDKPFAASETASFASWARNLTDSPEGHIIGLLDLHSYSQEVLYPYSYSCAAIPPSLEDLQELGLGISRAIHRTYGRAYGVAPACAANSFNVGNQKDSTRSVGDGSISGSSNDAKSYSTNPKQGFLGAGGSQLDWMYHELGVRHAFQIKLPDTGSYGFLLPKEEIVPTGKEIFNAVVDYGKFLLSEKEKQTWVPTDAESGRWNSEECEDYASTGEDYIENFDESGNKVENEDDDVTEIEENEVSSTPLDEDDAQSRFELRKRR